MGLRTDTKDFPFSCRERSVWYFMIDWETKSEKIFDYVGEKEELVRSLAQIIERDVVKNYSLFGVWTGQYRTDMFKLDIVEGYNQMKAHFPNKVS